MVWAGHGDEPSHQGVRVVLAHPLPGDRATEAVRHDVDLRRAGVVEHGLYELPEVGDARRRGVRQRRADRLVRRASHTDRPGNPGPTTPTAGSHDAGSTPRSRAGFRTQGCTPSGTACRCCRAGRSRVCAIGPSSEPKPISGVPSDASRITGKSAGKLVPSSRSLACAGAAVASPAATRATTARSSMAAPRGRRSRRTLPPAQRMNGG